MLPYSAGQGFTQDTMEVACVTWSLISVGNDSGGLDSVPLETVSVICLVPELEDLKSDPRRVCQAEHLTSSCGLGFTKHGN